MSTIKLKRSAVAGKVPTVENLVLGELAVNTYDGKVFMKKNDGADAIVQVGGPHGHSAGDINTGTLAADRLPTIPKELANLPLEAGDLIYRDASALARLAKGTDGQVVTLASGLPTWAAPDKPSTTYGAIGTYMIAKNISGGRRTSNSIVSGSEMEPSAIPVSSQPSTGVSGSWRVMATVDSNSLALYVRIS